MRQTAQARQAFVREFHVTERQKHQSRKPTDDGDAFVVHLGRTEIERFQTVDPLYLVKVRIRSPIAVEMKPSYRHARQKTPDRSVGSAAHKNLNPKARRADGDTGSF
jgi:hypothetical protein